jgi:hypothetical protein
MKTDREIISFLFDLIDDIDTQSDVCKGDHKAYRKRVEKLQLLRYETGITSDGYKLFMPNGEALPNREVFRL